MATLVQTPKGEHVLKDAMSANLSPTGIHIRGVLDEGRSAPEVGTRILVAFSLPNLDRRFREEAEVVWVSPPTGGDGPQVFGFGLRFSQLDAPEAEALSAYVSEFRYRVLLMDPRSEHGSFAEQLSDSYRVVSARSRSDAVAVLKEQDIAALVWFDGSEAGREDLRSIRASLPTMTEMVLVKGALDEIHDRRPVVSFDPSVDASQLEQLVDSAVRLYEHRAENERLTWELERATRELLRDNMNLRARAERTRGFDKIVGESRALRDVLRRMEQVAEYPTTVHIRGETGTGKELIARAIHSASPRRDRNFVAYNCAGIPEALVQSTLFGYRKGAFTGATQDRKGIFEEADGGTVFLDEIGDISPVIQTSLLRVLQEQEIVPVGATRARKIDVRIISATHHDLYADCREGKFREDLYYRLVVADIQVPPLRERIEDIPALAKFFLRTVGERFGKKIGAFTESSMAALQAYDWPGNVRELENEVKRAVIHSLSETLKVSDLSPRVRASKTSDRARIDHDGLSLPEAVLDLERRMIRTALQENNNVVARAAEALGVQASTLHKKIKRLGL